jgi:hemoglobin
MSELQTVYEAIGGEKALRQLVNIFYDNVANNSTLRPLFPDDFTEVREQQYWFLTQFFGGPPLYLQNRGQPKLRMRHMAFRITPTHAKAWLECMHDALTRTIESESLRNFMFERLTLTAYHMVNSPDDPVGSGDDTDVPEEKTTSRHLTLRGEPDTR